MSIKDLSSALTYGEALTRASLFLKKNGKEAHLAEWLLKERFDFSLTDLVQKQRHVMRTDEKEQFIKDILEAVEGKPVQYIVGHEWFYGRRFHVSQDTLIPRPETEEWFDHYIKTLPNRALNVLDIGTGSGVLAISHKLERPQDKVTAVDISPNTLNMAIKNAEEMEADVTFIISDMTKQVTGPFDLILSNPPYIGSEELQAMDDSVLAFEPHEALFAKDEGLFFYKQLAHTIPDILSQTGLIIMELGYKQGQAIKGLYEEAFPKAQVEIRKDFSGHDRTLYVRR
ncbi:peptide chain release factor N(5)-glutamine methyltransferase [Alkalibacterium sp. MB6]|uniref:peptide chain release factor N(5)-glutamine methyltransferase n=1 Tax=Alkalibacterium sp. MB6 TaxID=2081965 RepID=UPI00137A35AF|nr:peptide chain release factor N(5)-glutamine methyltransferase [Alkalibacterium sp. MB6]